MVHCLGLGAGAASQGTPTADDRLSLRASMREHGVGWYVVVVLGLLGLADVHRRQLAQHAQIVQRVDVAGDGEFEPSAEAVAVDRCHDGNGRRLENGNRIAEQRQIVRRGIARTFQHVQLRQTMSVVENVAIGALFKYAMVFSSSQNQALNNYAFVPNGYNYGNTADQALVGGSLQNDSFYSILGTVKVAF